MPNGGGADVDATVGMPWASLEETEKYYGLNEQELEFFKTATGIKDEQALKEHIFKVQRDAYKVSPLVSCRPSSVAESTSGPRLPLHSSVLVHEVRILTSL